MKYFVCLFFILSLSYSCFKPPSPPLQPPGVKSDIPNLFPTEKDFPKEIKISGEYILTKENKNFQFNSENKDWYCYKIKNYINPSDEDLVPIRFRLYDKENKLLHERLPFTNEAGRRSIIKFNKKLKEYPKVAKEETNTVQTYIPYHKEGVKIKAILVDDEGKDLRVLGERGVLPPEEFRERVFYGDCYREVGFGIE